MTRLDRLRILIADDDAAVREVLTEVIHGEPSFELVGVAENAPDAIACAAAEHPDVVLLDVGMPGGGGLAVAKGITKLSSASKMIALSGQSDRSTVLEMLEAGAVGYLVKGSSIGEIVGAVKDAARGRGSLSADVATDLIAELAGQMSVRSQALKKQQVRERRIGRAIRNEDAIAMVFQPIVALQGRKRVGVEALARFAGPPKNRPPDVWFAEAAEVDLGSELELAAVRKGIAALDRFPRGLYLSVNVSPATLVTAAFDRLAAQVGDGRLVVEITEHTVIEDYERVGFAVDRLRARGVRLAVDDAGSGFSSLRHILELNLDLIKLDPTLIRNLHLDQSKQALAAGLISFAEQSGATIIAEGVESAAEVKALIKLGVAYGQGYFLGRPAPAPPLIEMQKRAGRRGEAVQLDPQAA